MHIGSPQWIDLIVQGSREMGIAVTSEQAGRFAGHALSLLKWNRKINLTAITEPVDVAVKHFLDAIAPFAYIPAGTRVLDIGTGGGFPGIPLKILRPHQPMTLIDASRKKINFIKNLIRSLQLEHIAALHTRAQDLARSADHAKQYPLIICRALAELPLIVRMALPLLSANGRIIAMKGPQEPFGQPDAGDNGSADRVTIENQHFQTRPLIYQLPILGDQRRLVIIDALEN
jgi:16S rRNA (guanine527-N7)-methyltransferase